MIQPGTKQHELPDRVICRPFAGEHFPGEKEGTRDSRDTLAPGSTHGRQEFGLGVAPGGSETAVKWHVLRWRRSTATSVGGDTVGAQENAAELGLRAQAQSLTDGLHETL